VLRFLCFASLLAAILLWVGGSSLWGGDSVNLETSVMAGSSGVSTTSKPPCSSNSSGAITITWHTVGKAGEIITARQNS